MKSKTVTKNKVEEVVEENIYGFKKFLEGYQTKIDNILKDFHDLDRLTSTQIKQSLAHQLLSVAKNEVKKKLKEIIKTEENLKKLFVFRVLSTQLNDQLGNTKIEYIGYCTQAFRDDFV